MRRERKERLLKRAVQTEKEERKEAVLLGQLYRDRLQRENKLDTGEDRLNQRRGRNQKIRTYFQIYYEGEQSNSREAERNEVGSVSLERSLIQNS